MAVANLNELPIQYKNVIISLDAFGDQNKSFKLDIVKNCLLQKEQRLEMCDTVNLDSILFSFNRVRQQPCKFFHRYCHQHEGTEDCY